MSIVGQSNGHRRLAIFGATRGIGLQLVEQALEQKHEVAALVRDRRPLEELAARIGHGAARLHVVEGDATRGADVERTIQGADAVLCALGAPALSRSRVRSEGTRQIVAAMERAGIRRLICVSVLGAGESRSGLPFFLRYLMFPLYLRRAVADHEAQEAILRGSELAWTVVRPPYLEDGPRTGGYAHGIGDDLRGLSLKVSRADVAEFMLAQLDEAGYVRRAVAISNRRPGAVSWLAAPRPIH